MFEKKNEESLTHVKFGFDYRLWQYEKTVIDCCTYEQEFENCSQKTRK